MSANVKLREQHPIEAILSYIKKQSIFYSKQVKLYEEGSLLSIYIHLKFNELKCIYLESVNKSFLTPFANKHLTEIKDIANKYSVNIIKEDEYTVWKRDEIYRPHILILSIGAGVSVQIVIILRKIYFLVNICTLFGSITKTEVCLLNLQMTLGTRFVRVMKLIDISLGNAILYLHWMKYCRQLRM